MQRFCFIDFYYLFYVWLQNFIKWASAWDPCYSLPKVLSPPAVTRIRTEVAAATTQSTNHYTITARHCAVGEMRYCSFNFDKSVPITVLLCCWIIAGTPDSLSHLPSVTPSQICCIFHFPCVQSLSPHGLPEVIFALSLPPLLHSSLFIFLF